MILEKKLTIREVKNEIKHLENELDLYATQRNINFLKTQPGAIKIKADSYTHLTLPTICSV